MTGQWRRRRRPWWRWEDVVIGGMVVGAVVAIVVIDPVDPTELQAEEAGRVAEGLVSRLEARGAKLQGLGERGGLHGYLVRLADGDVYTLYLTDDGYAVMGVLYGPDGAELTGGQVAGLQRSEARDSEAAGGPRVVDRSWSDERRFRETASGAGFELGETGPEVVVFGDPTCRWSRATVARLGTAALEGALKLRVLPVGVLGADSQRRAAAVLGSGSPGLAWFEPGSAGPTAKGERLVTANNALFSAWNEDAVPLVLYRASEGVVRHVGDIEDVGSWLDGVGR